MAHLRKCAFASLAILAVGFSCDRIEKIPGIYCDSDGDCTRPDLPKCDTEFHSCYKPDADLGVDMQPDLPPMCSDDSVCPVALPVCGGGGQCGGCQLGNNTACATHHAATPLCGPSGACVECLSKDDCASKNQTCNLTTNACAACRAHARRGCVSREERAPPRPRSPTSTTRTARR